MRLLKPQLALRTVCVLVLLVVATIGAGVTAPLDYGSELGREVVVNSDLAPLQMTAQGEALDLLWPAGKFTSCTGDGDGTEAGIIERLKKWWKRSKRSSRRSSSEYGAT